MKLFLSLVVFAVFAVVFAIALVATPLRARRKPADAAAENDS